MPKKTEPVNPVKFLIDEAGRSNEWVACAAGISVTSTRNYYAGGTISRHIKPVLLRLMRREENRLAAQIIKEASKP